jgi:apolipoprotein D and lipocalin family protein
MRLIFIALAAAGLVACASQRLPELEPVDSVDLERFMGDWYVIAVIPTRLEREAYNAVESYALAADGTVRTTFTFNKGSLDGPLKVYNPRGFVRDGTGNAVWGMRFVWPFKADYRIIHLDPDYRTTVIGRQKRDYVWVMAREAQVDEATWARLERVVADAGYDLAELRRVPHREVEGGGME